jgi:hypothetical protein
MGDVEYDLKKASIYMVNGTLMAKSGRDRVNESRALRHLVSTNRPGVAGGKTKALYSDFNVHGLKCGPILPAHVLRAAPTRIEYVGSSAAPVLLSGLPLGTGVVTAEHD